MKRTERLKQPKILYERIKKNLEYEDVKKKYEELLAQPDLPSESLSKSKQLVKLIEINFKNSIARIQARTSEHKTKA